MTHSIDHNRPVRGTAHSGWIGRAQASRAEGMELEFRLSQTNDLQIDTRYLLAWCSAFQG